MSVYHMYKVLHKLPLGNWLFTRAVCFKAPYFSTIRPYIESMQAGEAVVRFKKCRRVHNHIKTVHVIAICNGLEVAMGMVVEASIPAHLRWLPKSMSLMYPAKADTDIRAVAKVNVSDFQADSEVRVEVKAYRSDGEIVVEGEIVVWVTEKPPRRGASA